MSVFGPGVGGGMLAAAGALNGLGQGMTQVGEAQQKENLASKMSQLETTRQEAITRLQGAQGMQLEEARSGHEDTRVEKEIKGRSDVAHYETEEKEGESAKQRSFTGEQNTAKFGSEEKRTKMNADSRIEAARLRAGAVGAGKNPPKEWQAKTVNLQGSFDPTSHALIPGRGLSIMTHRDGSQWIQTGDKLVPYDASAPEGHGDMSALRRAPAGAVQALIKDPLGNAPSGLSKKDSFVKQFGYLPLPYLHASQAARDSMAPKSGGGGAAPVNEKDDSEPDEPDSSVPMTE